MSKSFNELLSNNFDDILTLNNLLSFYEIIELRVFNHLTKDIKINQKENVISKETKDKIEELLNNKDLVINKDIFKNAVQKYILRYCIGDNNNKNDIINNIKNADKFFNKLDIFGEKIRKDEKFGKSLDKLKSINDEKNSLMKYCINIIFFKENEKKDIPDKYGDNGYNIKLNNIIDNDSKDYNNEQEQDENDEKEIAMENEDNLYDEFNNAIKKNRPKNYG